MHSIANKTEETTRPGHGAKLPQKKEQAIIALLACPTIHAAAEQIGIAPVTLYRWLREESFVEAYREARKEAVGRAITVIQNSAGEAVRTLSQIMQDPNASPSSRVSAAKTVLEFSIKAVEIDELERRIKTLEERGS